MVELELSNPLTIEERLEVPRLIEHDSSVYWADLRNLPIASPDLDQEEYHAIVEHLAHIEQTVVTFTQAEAVYLRDSFYSTSLDKRSLEIMTNRLSKALLEGKLDASIGDIGSFLSLRPVMHSVLYNLIKNGVAAQAKTDDSNEAVNLTVDYHSGFPETTLFVPEGARDYTDFITFAVHNKGRSFPGDVPLESYFTGPAPERGEGGFGLYFIRLAAKFLRAPVNITSEPGDTTVSFYHPVYVDLKQGK